MIDENYVLNSRITADMFPLSRQIQIAGDNLKGMVARMTGIQAPKTADDETAIAQLIYRLEKTLLFVNSIPE